MKLLIDWDGGSKVSIGNVTRRFTSDGLESPVGVEGVDIVAKDLSFAVGDRELLKDINFHLGPRSLTAIVGPSGAGKSTLLNAIPGRTTPSQGEILIGGRNLHKEYGDLSQRIGLVPQADILHTRLTVRQALTYGAALRFPSETSAAERDERVEKAPRIKPETSANAGKSKLIAIGAAALVLIGGGIFALTSGSSGKPDAPAATTITYGWSALIAGESKAQTGTGTTFDTIVVSGREVEQSGSVNYFVTGTTDSGYNFRYDFTVTVVPQ